MHQAGAVLRTCQRDVECALRIDLVRGLLLGLRTIDRVECRAVEDDLGTVARQRSVDRRQVGH